MKLISSRYPSSWELKHAYSTDEAMGLVKQHLDSGQDIEGMGQLRRFLMLDFDSEVIKQVEDGEWLLIKDEAYYFDWGQFDKSVRQQLFDHKVKELRNAPPVPKTRYGQVFRVTNSETGEPLYLRRFIATVDGKRSELRTNFNGLAQVFAPAADMPISIQVAFKTPVRELEDLLDETPTDSRFVTIAKSQELTASAPIISITVNDRAMAREIIINNIKMADCYFAERSEWGSVRDTEKMNYDWDYSMIALHHAGRSYGCGDFGSLEMKRILSNHLNKYDDIGYHFGIDCAGQIFEGRDIRLKSASVHKYNTRLIGIVLLEDLTTLHEANDKLETVRDYMEVWEHQTQNSATTKQIEALKILIDAIRNVFEIEILGGHREFPNQVEEGKICPGNNGMEVVKEMRTITGLKAP